MPILRIRLLCLLSCVSLLSLAAPAQDQKSQQDASNAFILKARQQPAYVHALELLAQKYEAAMDTHCKDVKLNFTGEEVFDQLLENVALNPQGRAIAGAWQESTPGQACGKHRLYNVKVTETLGHERFVALVPGQAVGDPQLQRDTLANVQHVFALRHLQPKPSCKVSVVDSHLVGAASSPLPNGMMSPWKETWDVETCGGVWRVPIAFTPGTHGTDVLIMPLDVKPL